MRVTPTDLDGVLMIEPAVFRDTRGFFLETYKRDAYRAAGIPLEFVQHNRSRSERGVLRGLHFQEPTSQGKLVHVVRGAIFDVVVDIRRGSPDFGRWSAFELSAESFRQLWIPPGFAHGLLALADETEVDYKCTDVYVPEHEYCLLWNDPAIGIDWPKLDVAPRLSSKDIVGLPLSNLPVLPTYESR